MTITLEIDPASAEWAEALSRLAEGDDVVVARGGQPVARLVAVPHPPAHAEPTAVRPGRGLLKGQIWIAPDFDELPEDFLELFYAPLDEGLEPE